MTEENTVMKVLYIHIGTPKTGTTAIQAFCQENQKVLEKRGYCYPIFPYTYADAIQRRNGHFLVGYLKKENGDRDNEKEEQIFREGMDRIYALFETYHSVILSDEYIWTITRNKRTSLWKELAEEAKQHNFQVKIIVYLRRQDEYLSSSWNQTVKVGTIKECVYTWDKYLENIPEIKQQDYAKKLDSIAAALGKENVIVRRYERSGFFGGSIYADFLNAVGLELNDEYFIKRENRNGSLIGNTHEIKRVLNTLTLNREQNEFFRDVLLEFAQLSDEKYKSSVLSKDEAQKIIDEYKDGNERIAREYLHKNDGMLFDENIKDLTKWQKDNPYMLDDMIRFTGMNTIFLLKEIEKMRNEQEKLKKEIQILKESQKKNLVKKLVQKVKSK